MHLTGVYRPRRPVKAGDEKLNHERPERACQAVPFGDEAELGSVLADG